MHTKYEMRSNFMYLWASFCSKERMFVCSLMRENKPPEFSVSE